MRRRIIAGNWKMHKTAAQTHAFFEHFLRHVPALPHGVQVVIAPPFTALQTAAACLRGQDRVELGAQNVHWEQQGPFTGEVSIPMLAEFRVKFVIVGHSERRLYFGETDENVNRKVHALLEAGMTPIVAVGETIAQREADVTRDVVISQTRAAFEHVSPEHVARAVVAYEPVWAIGTGLSCDPAEANRVMSEIRGSVRGLEDAPILYGGSVKTSNAAEYAAQPNINGGLVGGASLDPDDFAALIEAARG